MIMAFSFSLRIYSESRRFYMPYNGRDSEIYIRKDAEQMEVPKTIKKMEYYRRVRSERRWLKRKVRMLEITPDEAVHKLKSFKGNMKEELFGSEYAII